MILIVFKKRRKASSSGYHLSALQRLQFRVCVALVFPLDATEAKYLAVEDNLRQA